MHLLLLAALVCQEPAPSKLKAEEVYAFPRPKQIETPPGATIDAAINKGIKWLVEHQNPDGSFGSPTKTKDLNIYAPVPGAHHAFTAATTSLGIAAIIEGGERGSATREALEKAEKYLVENLPKVKRATPDAIYNVWAHAYGIQALVRMHQRLPDDKERQKKIEDLIRLQFDYLDRYESVDGGWGYYDFRIGSKKPATDSTPFTTAAVLVAFHDAKVIGLDPPPKLVKRAVDSLIRMRNPDFSYWYGEYFRWMPHADINKPGGSLGRSQACNAALRYWGDAKTTDFWIMTWLNRLVTQNIWLDLGRKRPIPHESKFAVAGYFYYFGHYYAGLCIELLPAKERPFYQDQLAKIILDRQEQDGSWFDYPLYDYGHPYGTSFAVMTLLRCKHGAAVGPKKEDTLPPTGKPLGMAAVGGLLVGLHPPLEPRRADARRSRGHAHNDYLHAKPLTTALELGFGSVEVDVHLKNGELLVGHDDWQLTKGRTLEKLYLAPLRERAKTSGGVHPRREPLILLIDLKTDGPTTYAALHKLLEQYRDILTEVKDGEVTQRAVTAIISGNVPRNEILAQKQRFAAIDGRLSDLDSELPAHAMPLISDQWGKHFKWKGEVVMPEAEARKLKEIVAKVHSKGRTLRFWATPEDNAVWEVLSKAKVDFIGTDQLQRLHNYLELRTYVDDVSVSNSRLWQLEQDAIEAKVEGEVLRATLNGRPLPKKTAYDKAFGPMATVSPHIVFVTGDCEYRSEISMPMLAGILEKHHGCKCTVCYAVDDAGNKNPKALKSIAGLEALKTADLAVFFLRYRHLPPEQVAMIEQYVQSGKPLVGFRTTTHAFRYPEGDLAKLNDGFGRDVFGQKWISHHGHDSSTKVYATLADHPITRGVAKEFFCRSWLYHVNPLSGDCQTLAVGQAVKGEKPDGQLFGQANPVAWTKSLGKARVFFTTLGHPKDFEDESVRKLSLNGIWWALGREQDIPKTGLTAEPAEPYKAPNTH